MGVGVGVGVVGHGTWAEYGWAWYIVRVMWAGRGTWAWYMSVVFGLGVVCRHSIWDGCGTWDTYIDHRFEM